MSELPVYKLAPAVRPSLNTMDMMANWFFDVESYSMQTVNGREVLQSENKLIEFDNEQGSVWMADQTQLWNPEMEARLPEKREVRENGEQFIRDNELLADLERDDRFEVEVVDISPSFAVTLDKTTGQEYQRLLDFRLSYAARVLVTDPEEGTEIGLPILGGCGKANVTMGNAGRVIGFNRLWRPIDTVEMKAAIIPRGVADKQFQKMTSNMQVESFTADLAYECGNFGRDQYYLYPVWAYRAEGNIDEHQFALRIITLPATEFGPNLQLEQPQPSRTPRGTLREWDLATARRTYRSGNPFEAGTSWIGSIGGLSGSKKNAQGFIDGLRDAGWNINFNWGNCDAWETDWHKNDDTYVDAVDFVFYTGHAGPDGWQLVNRADCKSDFLVPAEVGAVPESPGDIWGRQDLEWIIVAACGPLQDDRTGQGGGNVFTHWDGAFDGLHILLGYAAATKDNEEEGKRIIKYAREGQTLIDAWFRTAIEIQPSTNGYAAPYGPKVYAAALYGYNSGQTSPRNDHLWGYGSVAPDPIKPKNFTCIYVPC